MNWLVFLLVGWFAFGLELGLRDALRLAPGDVAPSFIVPVMVFVCLSAPGRQALWASLLLGVLVDLTWIIPRTDAASTASILGPYSLGMLVAAQLILAVRGMVIRRHPLTITVLSVAAAVVANVVVVAFLTVRDLYGDPILFTPTSDLVSRLFSSLYTGATAFVWALALRLIDPAFQFHQERGLRRH